MTLISICVDIVFHSRCQHICVSVIHLRSITVATHIFKNLTFTLLLHFFSHPKYRQALEKKFPSLVCANKADAADNVSTATGACTVADEKSIA